MKILNFDAFIQMPPGTIYSEYEPNYCRGLFRKGDNVPSHDGPIGDFFSASIEAECVNGDHPTVEHIESRWGLFDYNAQFAVYEPEDIATIKAMLG